VRVDREDPQADKSAQTARLLQLLVA
jgi:hypothetical protein